MKYIRTGSEIYDIDDLYVCEDLVGKPYATKNGAWCIYKESIIKEADTIEELCDFKRVEIISDNESIAIRILGMYRELPPNPSIKTGTYGAILTDKGLIFVAKMNDKGELELL